MSRVAAPSARSPAISGGLRIALARRELHLAAERRPGLLVERACLGGELDRREDPVDRFDFRLRIAGAARSPSERSGTADRASRGSSESILIIRSAFDSAKFVDLQRAQDIVLDLQLGLLRRARPTRAKRG
jgi:hypothetical protein